ncbi:MAG: ABC transporter substrate-binding protein [Actinomycetota bacterium]|nr:ABC transporter substrate-binding protein [Actinomycetota bacterium]
MAKRSWLSSIAMLAGGASLIVAAFASPAAGGSADSEVRRGGTIRVNMPGSDIDDIDPSIAYGTYSWSMMYAVGLKLLNYSDAPAPAGSRLRPEGASSFSVSRDGKTYTFVIRGGNRFSNGKPVTARSYAYAINRSLDRGLQSPAFQFISDPSGSNIVGAQDVRDGKADKARGVRVKGNRLTIQLTRPDATFLAKITMPFFQAMDQTTLPRSKKVNSVANRNDLATAGPYYISFREPNRTVIMSRNPFYRGNRPRNADRFEFRANVDPEASYRQIVAGEVDTAFSLPPTAPSELAQQHGVNRGRFRVEPLNCVRYLALNTARPLFRNNIPLRKAVNFAISRTAMNQQYGAFAGRPHDQVLPPGFPGYRNVNLYPATPNMNRARQLARGNTRAGKAVVYYGLTGVGPQLLELTRAALGQLGIEVDARGFRGFAIYDAAGKRGSEHDIVVGSGWCQDYPDPYNFVNVLLYGGNIQADNNNNLAYFNNPAYNRKMERASRLLGAARLKAYGDLDIDITQNQAPWASWQNINDRWFFSSRIDMRTYVWQPIYENPVWTRLALR